MIPPLTELNKTDAVRLIPTAFYKPPVLRPLVDDEDELAILAGIEGLTSSRLRAERQGAPGLDMRELVFGIWGETMINAAFAYTRKGGNRFNDETRGAWYAAFDDMTAIREVGFHKTRELDFIGVFEDETVYQALLAAFVGEFHDLRNAKPAPDCLDPDPAIAYRAGQELARTLRARPHLSRGLVYPSRRRDRGECLVAFHPHVVQNLRPGARWKLSWRGSPEFTISQDAG